MEHRGNLQFYRFVFGRKKIKRPVSFIGTMFYIYAYKQLEGNDRDQRR